MTTLAVAPRRRRALERQGMTPEQELELLITEQQADDTYIISRPGEISFDAPAPNGEGVIGDLIGLDEDGNLVVFVRPTVSGLVDARDIPHGTIGGYNNHKCRCIPCRGSIADYRRRRRADA